MPWDLFDESGEPLEPVQCNAATTTMLDQLAWWATALRTARTAEPTNAAASEPVNPLASLAGANGSGR